MFVYGDASVHVSELLKLPRRARPYYPSAATIVDSLAGMSHVAIRLG